MQARLISGSRWSHVRIQVTTVTLHPQSLQYLMQHVSPTLAVSYLGYRVVMSRYGV